MIETIRIILVVFAVGVWAFMALVFVLAMREKWAERRERWKATRPIPMVRVRPTRVIVWELGGPSPVLEGDPSPIFEVVYEQPTFHCEVGPDDAFIDPPAIRNGETLIVEFHNQVREAGKL